MDKYRSLLLGALAVLVLIAVGAYISSLLTKDGAVEQEAGVTDPNSHRIDEDSLPPESIDAPESDPVIEVDGLLSNFYAAFGEMDKEKLFSYFTEPSTNDERQLQSLLLNGRFPDGTPGGPVLFGSQVASGVVKNYTTVSATESEDTTLVEVSEVVDYPEKAGVERSRILELQQTTDGYLIIRYYKPGDQGKYSGFLN